MPLFFEKFTWFFILLVLFSAGCTSHDPNPELKDPIYLDLKNIVGDLASDVAIHKATIDDETKNKDLAEPRSKDLALTRNRLREAEQRLKKAEQALNYYEIKVERRRLEARLAYEKAHQKGESWPDPAEFQAYQTNKELKSANQQWSARVPKLQERIESFQKVVPAPKTSDSEK